MQGVGDGGGPGGGALPDPALREQRRGFGEGLNNALLGRPGLRRGLGRQRPPETQGRALVVIGRTGFRVRQPSPSRPCVRHRNDKHTGQERGDAMVQTSTAHGERINLRPGETAKRRIEQAASVEGKTVGACIVSSALATAGKTIDRHETLARDDALRFFAALVDPPPPGARLRAALAEHARRVARR